MTTKPLFINPMDPNHVSDDEFFGISKIAGARLSSDARLWEQEIAQHVHSELGFLPLDDMTVHMDRFDPVQGTAVGAAVLADSGVNFPFIVRKDKNTNTSEVLPIDVFEHEGRLMPITPSAVKQAVLTRNIGAPLGQDAARRGQVQPGSNPYIGDMTGDVSPLQGGSTVGTLATKTAAKMPGKQLLRGAVLGGIGGFGLQATRELENMDRRAEAAGRKVTAMDRVKAIQRALVRGGTVGAAIGALHSSASHALGVEDKFRVKSSADLGFGRAPSVFSAEFMKKLAYSLHPNDINNFRRVMINNPMLLQAENLAGMELILRQRNTVDEKVKTQRPNILVVKRDDLTGEITAKVPGEPAQVIRDPDELKSMLGHQYETAIAKLKSHGVFVTTENIQSTTWSVNRLGGIGTVEVSEGGGFLVSLRNGKSVPAIVATGVFRPSGNVFPGKFVITPNFDYGFSDHVYGTPLGKTTLMPNAEPKEGQLGVFSVVVNNQVIVTTPMTVRKIVILKEGVDVNRGLGMFVVEDNITGLMMSLVPSAAVNGFVRVRDITNSSNPLLALAKGEVFYIPEAAIFTPLKARLQLAETVEQLQKVAEDAHAASGIRVRRFGHDAWEIGTDKVAMNLNDHGAFELLVGMGVTSEKDLVEIQTACMDDVDGVILSGLTMPQGRGERAVVKEAAEKVSVDEQALINSLRRESEGLLKVAAETGDADTVNSILSLNFLNTENMRSFIESSDEFDRVSSKLAKLLIATRLGLPNVREASVKEAMDGMARTCDQLRLLKSAFNYRREQEHGVV